MTNAVIFEDAAVVSSGDACTHAIIISVGDYPHLEGGSGTLTDLHGDMGQLSSPPNSGFEVANWLLNDFNNPEKRLATVSMLTSSADSDEYEHQLVPKLAPQRATLANAKKAIRAWKKRGDDNEDNLMLFFFCGHGVARGLDGLTLLMEDYGEDDVMPMDGAMDFAAFHRGMAQCAASEQCYFMDTCRVVSDIAKQTTAKGHPIIQDDDNRPFDSDWKYAIFYATLEGEMAYGRKDKPSFYTEELTKGLSGMASHNRHADGRWRVSTGMLNTALHYGLSKRGKKIKIPMAAQAEFDFHLLKSDPEVPITVFCSTAADHKQAKLSCHSKGALVQKREPKPEKWITNVPQGVYDFRAEIEARRGERNGESIMPPYREIMLEVES